MNNHNDSIFVRSKPAPPASSWWTLPQVQADRSAFQQTAKQEWPRMATAVNKMPNKVAE